MSTFQGGVQQPPRVVEEDILDLHGGQSGLLTCPVESVDFLVEEEAQSLGLSPALSSGSNPLAVRTSSSSRRRVMYPRVLL